MKYKLIKEYPGSLELGTVVTLYSDLNTYGIENIYMFGKEYIENNPEFWEKIEEEKLCVPFGTKVKNKCNHTIYTFKDSLKEGKVNVCWETGNTEYSITLVNGFIKKDFWVIQEDFEILSFRGVEDGGLTTKKSNGYWIYGDNSPEDCPNGKGATLEEMLEWVEEGEDEIYSIKRLSDGEVFSVGDTISSTGKNLKITEICIDDAWAGGAKLRCENFDEVCLETAELKEPLFVSKDGVEIFEGDEFYCVDNGDYSTNKRIGGDGLAYHLEDVVDRCYSTEKSAEEYILMNKPCLSINDILESSNNTDLINHVAIGNIIEKASI